MDKEKIEEVIDRCLELIGETESKRPEEVVKELGYDDSLRWLFHHYPNGAGDNTNCILLNGNNRVLAISYHGHEETSIIASIDAVVVPKYTVVNNSKKIDKEYYREDIEELIYVTKNI